MANDRNPILLPELKSKKPGCPKCGNEVFTGKKIYGVITFRCHKCSNEWQGGLPRVPEDPLRPILPTAPPPVEQVAIRDREGNTVGFEERLRPVSTIQDFRRGAVIPEDGEL